MDAMLLREGEVGGDVLLVEGRLLAAAGLRVKYWKVFALMDAASLAISDSRGASRDGSQWSA